MREIFITILLAVSVAAQTVPLADTSASGRPISLKGTITYTSSGRASCSITAHNNSSQVIVASLLVMDLVNPDGSTQHLIATRDSFFSKISRSFPDRSREWTLTRTWTKDVLT